MEDLFAIHTATEDMNLYISAPVSSTPRDTSVCDAVRTTPVRPSLLTTVSYRSEVCISVLYQVSKYKGVNELTLWEKDLLEKSTDAQWFKIFTAL
jgi:hypothetical protein